MLVDPQALTPRRALINVVRHAQRGLSVKPSATDDAALANP